MISRDLAMVGLYRPASGGGAGIITGGAEHSGCLRRISAAATYYPTGSSTPFQWASAAGGGTGNWVTASSATLAQDDPSDLGFTVSGSPSGTFTITHSFFGAPC